MVGTYYIPGGHNIICERTGYKIKASHSLKEWNNLVVRRESFEERHPQDTIRSFADNQSVLDPRPESTDAFISSVDSDTLKATTSGNSDYTIWDVSETDSIQTEWDAAITVWID